MSNPDAWRTFRTFLTMSLLLQALLCLPLLAGTLPPNDRENQETTIEIAALEGLGAGRALPPSGPVDQGEFRSKVAEARAILEDLRTFAGAAQRAIRAGEEISALRLENQRLKQGIVDQAEGRGDLERDLAVSRAQTSRLTGTVVANWLASLELGRRNDAGDERLAAAQADWIKTESRLLALKKQVDAFRRMTHELRARRAALAAEIGRTRRQVINLEDQTRVLERDREALEATARQLRHGISARLRTLLVSH